MKAIVGLAVVGVVGWALLAIGFAVEPGQALFSYLTAYVTAATLAIGALVLVMMGVTAKATWFVVLRRLAEAVMTTLPLLIVLFVPIALGLRWLFPWAAPDSALSPEIYDAVKPKRAWLEPGFFIARSFGYLVIWAGIAVLLRRMSVRQDDDPSRERAERYRALAAGAIPLVGLTVTFAAFDWVMSLDPRWYSTTFGLYVFSGGFAGSVGLVTVAAWLAHRRAILPVENAPNRLHATGRVLFAFVIFWAYIGFTQLLIIWIADIPDEVRFYHARVAGTWAGVSFFLGAGHFVLPFFALLSRELKRRAAMLAVVGGWLVFAHWVDVYWMVMPALHGGGVRPHWLDLAAVAAVGAPLSAYALWRFRAAAPIPKNDPELPEGLRYETP